MAKKNKLSLQDVGAALGLEPLEEKEDETREILEIIGARRFINLCVSHSFGEKNCPQYELVARDSHNRFVVARLTNWYNDCYSSWTSATGGSFRGWEITNRVGIIHYVPKERLWVYRDLEDIEDCYGERALFTPDGVIVATEYDTGDQYYPSGGTTLNLDLFKPTERLAEKRPVFVFRGDSMLGKSTLAESSKLSSYEVEFRRFLPEDLHRYDIIICSPKSERRPATSLSKVLEALKGKGVDVRLVDFKAQEV
jgi:hypothetical protein